MTTSKRRVKEMKLSIWELDKDLTLTDVINNLSLDYDLQLDYLENRKDLPSEDKILKNGWHPQNGETSFSIKEITIANQKIKYVYAVGYYEKTRYRDKHIMSDTKVYIPRNVRIFNRSCNAVFFEYNGRVYTIVEVSSSDEGRVRSVLFGQGRKEKKKEQWKNINFREVKQFQFDSKFFYWLLSKNGSKFSLSSDPKFSIALIDVSAVAQITDKEEYDSTSKGTNVLSSLQALSGLGSNQSVYEAGFSFKLPKMDLTLRMSENSTCFIDLDSTNVVNDKMENVTAEDEFVRVSLTVYVVLLLTLKKEYNKAISGGFWTVKQEESQRKKWGLIVIRELCHENNISLEDISEMFYKDTTKVKSIKTETMI